jgi:hypothetical protein
MAGKQAEGAKHRDCFSCPPESLVVEDNKDGQAACAFARLLLGYRGADKNQCDDVAEVLDEIADAKKPVGRPKKQREAA